MSRSPNPMPALDALARALVPTAEEVGPTLIGVPDLPPPEVRDASFDLAVQETDDPVQGLTGFVAPDEWAAIGCTGIGRRTDIDTRQSTRVAIVHFVHRNGSSVSALMPLTSQAAAHDDRIELLHSDEPVAGLTADVLRRALDLPTAPPPPDTTEIWLLRWLDAVLTSAVKGRTLSSRSVARLHPAIGMIPSRTDADALIDAAADRLPRLTRIVGEEFTWEDLRLRATEVDGWRPHDMTAEIATWHDTGSFARAALAASPDLHQLVATLDDLLGGDAAILVRGVVDQLAAQSKAA